MAIIKLSHNDVNEMVSCVVRSVLNESINEVMGSVMADKDDVVEEIVQWVKDKWEKIKENDTEPDDKGTFVYENKKTGVKFNARYKQYFLFLPDKIAKKLDLADKFEFNIAITDHIITKEQEKYFEAPERGTEGASYAQREYNEYVSSTGKRKLSRIDFQVPSINGELQLQGFYSTIYHELNHDASRLSIQRKHQETMSDEDLASMHFFSASRRSGNPPHFKTSRVLNPPKDDILDALGVWFGYADSPEQKRAKEEMAFVFYAIWEITERNARAEGLYGDLQALNATREEFFQIYPKTELYRQIKELRDKLKYLEEVPTFGYGVPVWKYAANVMNMNPRGKNKGVAPSHTQIQNYLDAVKERFINRSEELLDKMYRKGMKVAELYFQRQEKKDDKPGGGVDRLRQIINNN